MQDLISAVGKLSHSPSKSEQRQSKRSQPQPSKRLPELHVALELAQSTIQGQMDEIVRLNNGIAELKNSMQRQQDTKKPQMPKRGFWDSCFSCILCTCADE